MPWCKIQVICFYKDWGRQFHKEYDVKKSKRIYFDKAYYDKDNNDAITFELNDKNMQDFLVGSVEQQKEILHNFLKRS